MSVDNVSLEDVKLNKFHWKITIYSAGGPFCDGYILSIIGIALTLLAPQLGLSSVMTGLIGSSALIGLFLGGLIFGYVTDLIGRQTMYLIDLSVFVVASVLQFFVGAGWQLLILRFILGIAVGADYPIASSLMAEFTPRRHRGFLLSFLIFGWWVGAATAYVVGYLLIGVSEDSWRWILASSAVPAAIILLLRLGTPESPRWLASKGRTDEAREIVKKVFGENVELGNLPPEPQKTSFWRIFRDGYGKRTTFVGLFWALQVIPTFAILTFSPMVLEAFGLNGGNLEYLGSVIISAFAVVGVLPALFLVNSMGRRPVLIWPFLITGLALLLVGVAPNATAIVIIISFIIFQMFNAGSSVVQFVYPNELFPTEIRATAAGFGTSMSRIGAAIGTFLLPILINGIGVRTTMIITAILCFVGFVISWLMAPETKNLTLDEASTVNRIDPSKSEGNTLKQS